MRFPVLSLITLLLALIPWQASQALTVIELIDVDAPATSRSPQVKRGLFGKVVEQAPPEMAMTLSERYQKDVNHKNRKPLQFQEDIPGESARFQLFRSQAVLARSNGANTNLIIDIADQKAYFFVDGIMALETPISTARSGKVTPKGSFSMTERVRDGKISNLYHVEMPYWMRLDQTPYGVHAGDLPGYPASAGCIRLPSPAAKIIYENTRTGTSVKIYNNWSPTVAPPAQRYAPVDPRYEPNKAGKKGKQKAIPAIPYPEGQVVVRRIEI